MKKAFDPTLTFEEYEFLFKFRNNILILCTNIAESYKKSNFYQEHKDNLHEIDLIPFAFILNKFNPLKVMLADDYISFNDNIAFIASFYFMNIQIEDNENRQNKFKIDFTKIGIDEQTTFIVRQAMKTYPELFQFGYYRVFANEWAKGVDFDNPKDTLHINHIYPDISANVIAPYGFLKNYYTEKMRDLSILDSFYDVLTNPKSLYNIAVREDPSIDILKLFKFKSKLIPSGLDKIKTDVKSIRDGTTPTFVKNIRTKVKVVESDFLHLPYYYNLKHVKTIDAYKNAYIYILECNYKAAMNALKTVFDEIEYHKNTAKLAIAKVNESVRFSKQFDNIAMIDKSKFKLSDVTLQFTVKEGTKLDKALVDSFNIKYGDYTDSGKPFKLYDRIDDDCIYTLIKLAYYKKDKEMKKQIIQSMPKFKDTYINNMLKEIFLNIVESSKSVIDKKKGVVNINLELTNPSYIVN